MSHPDFAVTVRALIVDKSELFMVKHQPDANYYALPGGHLELGESLEDGLVRELTEETGVKPEIGPLIFVNQWVGPTHHRVEFFFWVRNGAGYRHINLTSATHGFELSDHLFGDATDPKYNLLPSYLRQKFPRLIDLGEHYPTELVRSS